MAADSGVMRGLCGLLYRIQAIFAFIHVAGRKLACAGVSDQGECPMVADAAEHLAGPVPPVPNAAEVALFVDLDGTLVEFAQTPDAVVIDAALPLLLRELAAALDGALAIISSRPLATIDALLHSPQLVAAGQHGAELRHADGRVERALVDARALDTARAALRTRAAGTHGLHIEDKGIALAIHYRHAPRAEPLAHELAAAALQAAGTGFELQHGACAIELKSGRVDKGRAVATLATHAPFVGRRPWMLGDDYADEHAFALAQSLGGAGVMVGARTDTVAHYRLANPAAARAWLARILRRRENQA
jgi:trehalose 6-phosphate phosphatase